MAQQGGGGESIHVLGIESSCDDTGVGILREDGQVLSNCIHSQLKQHLSHGGIIPVIAKEYHLSNIDRVAREAFQVSKLNSVQQDITAIAVSNRPGLFFSLQVGLNYARKLAKKYSKPVIPIHHMQAHALMPLLQHRSIKFPYLALLISGGHCLLALAKRFNDFHILGSTTDEAPGDMLDKFARRTKLRNLGPPFDSISGGAAIELLARQEGADRFKYFGEVGRVPMLHKNGCDFSFSGYRGCFEVAEEIVDKLWLEGQRDKLKVELGHLCASLQRMVLIQLVKKVQRALAYYRMYWRYQNEDAFVCANQQTHLGFGLQELDSENAIDIVISGGVAANSYLTESIAKVCQESLDDTIRVYAPTKQLCSDNGLMVAWNGILRYRNYMENPEQFNGKQLDDSVVLGDSELDRLNVSADCKMGLDISDQVRQTHFKVRRLQHKELNLKPIRSVSDPKLI